MQLYKATATMLCHTQQQLLTLAYLPGRTVRSNFTIASISDCCCCGCCCCCCCYTMQVGEYLRRSEGIAMLGTDAQGNMQLDIPAIRQRISTVGSLYTPPGPHHTVTAQPGLGEAVTQQQRRQQQQ
jgi:hypothetical protein